MFALDVIINKIYIILKLKILLLLFNNSILNNIHTMENSNMNVYNVNVDWSDEKFNLHKAIKTMYMSSENIHRLNYIIHEPLDLPNEIIALMNEAKLKNDTSFVNAQYPELNNDTPFHLLVKYLYNKQSIWVYRYCSDLAFTIATHLLDNYNVNLSLINNNGLTVIEEATQYLISSAKSMNYNYTESGDGYSREINKKIKNNLVKMILLLKKYLKKQTVQLIKQTAIIVDMHFTEHIFDTNYHYQCWTDIFDFVDIISTV